MRAPRFDWIAAICAAGAIAGCSHHSKAPMAATEPEPAGQYAGEPAPAEPAAPMASEGDHDCALDIDLTGAEVKTIDIDGGVALVFTSDTGDAADLQHRVRMMMRGEAGAGSAAGQGGATGTGVGNSTVGDAGDADPDRTKLGDDQTPKVAIPPPPGADTTGDVAGETTDMSTYAVRHTLSGVPAIGKVIDVPGGARVELRAQDPADVDALREHARQHVAEVTGGECKHNAG